MIRYREEVELYVDLELDGDEHRARGSLSGSEDEERLASAQRTLYRATSQRHIVVSEISGLLYSPPVLPEQGRHLRRPEPAG